MYSTCHRGGIGRRAWFRSMYSQGCGGSSPFDGTKSFRSVRGPRTMRGTFACGGDVVFGVTIRARRWAVCVSPRYVSFAPSGLMLLFSRGTPDLAVWPAFLRRFAPRITPG